MSESSIMSVREMIDICFGEHDVNIVNFKLMQTILYLLARQQRLLERRVAVEFGKALVPRTSSLSITEVKLRASVVKKKKKPTKPGRPTTDAGGAESAKSKAEKFSKSTTDETTTSKSEKSSKAAAGGITKSKLDKSFESSSDEYTKSKSEKYSKSLKDEATKLKSEKSSKATADGITKSKVDKSFESSTDETTKSKAEKYSKSIKDGTAISTDKTLRSKAETISADKTSTSKSTSDKTTTSESATEKSAKSTQDTSKISKSLASRDKTSIEATEDKTGTLKDLYQTETSTSDKSTSKSTRETTKSSSEKTKYSSDKTKTTSSKPLSTKDHEDRDISGKSTKRDYHHLLELIEQQREEELRVVNQFTIIVFCFSRILRNHNELYKETVTHADEITGIILSYYSGCFPAAKRFCLRADSQEVADKTPTPMASLDSMEVQYEKLLLVERVPVEEAEKKIGRLRDKKVSKLDIVTQDEFDELVQTVKEIQTKFGLGDDAKLPENMQLMEDLSRGASLTDARAALLLAARLEFVEKTLKVMETVLTDLAAKKGIKLKQQRDGKERTYAVQYTQISVDTPETKVIYDAPSGPSNTSGKSGVGAEDVQMHQFSEPPFTETEDPVMDMLGTMPKSNNINIDDLDDAMQELYEELLKSVGILTNKAISKADEALKTACRLETKLDATMDVDTRMEGLETLVSEYAGKINALDTNLSSQMSNYQELLTQMQHDLEGGLETMAEALANPPGEIPGAAELNANFANLQIEFDTTTMRQKELKENQLVLSLDVQALWKEIELLREIKSDRDEVADALRDKAGLGALNGLVTQQQFDAVRGDFEQRIGASYDKFNNQEIVWQKIIDDLLRELNEKADWVQVSALRDDINNNLERLRNKIQMMMEIIGEPRAAAISRRLLRDAACLSCSTPAQINLEEPNLPALPAFSIASTRPPTIGAEGTTKPKEDGDHGLCYPGQPIPHPRDPRSHFCRRYCGGSHTAVRGAISRAPKELTISALHREAITGVGSDGKVYKMDEQENEKKPCLPCNIPPHVSEERQDYRFDADSETARFYVLPVMTSTGRAPTSASISVTPPLPSDDD